MAFITACIFVPLSSITYVTVPNHQGYCPQRGFPFDEDEGSDAWSSLAARHPDIAARLRTRPATWARKRRPSSQDATDDFGENFGFDRFPFDDIPSEFRDHFPTNWNRRFTARDEPQQPAPTSPQPHSPHSPQHHTISTQTDQQPGPSHEEPTHLPQYGLRNTVDLGQKSPADPSLVDAEDRSQRCMSAPPDSRSQNSPSMSGHSHHEHPPPPEQPSNVRHIPIFVEGRNEPVINKSVDNGAHYGEAKPAYAPPPQPHIDREQYFADDGPASFHHPPNFTRAFGGPFNKGFRQGPQPFVQQKAYPQAAYGHSASPQRSQSPKPQTHTEEPYVKMPVHHEHSAPKAEPPSRQQKQPPPQQKPAPQQQQQQQQQHPQGPAQHPPKSPTPPPQKPASNDPISVIINIQTDVLNLMTEVEKFTGTKNDKRYLFLDEMLTRNLIKLDNIETDGKENIRQARREAIKCIQKCITVLEAKAESNTLKASKPHDEENQENLNNEPEGSENGEVDMKENAKEKTSKHEVPTPQAEENKDEQKQGEAKTETKPEVVDTRPNDQNTETAQEDLPANTQEADKQTSKKGTKNVKKRDKSKDKGVPTDSTKAETEGKKEQLEIMQVDDKGEKQDSQVMDVDGAASQ